MVTDGAGTRDTGFDRLRKEPFGSSWGAGRGLGGRDELGCLWAPRNRVLSLNERRMAEDLGRVWVAGQVEWHQTQCGWWVVQI